MIIISTWIAASIAIFGYTEASWLALSLFFITWLSAMIWLFGKFKDGMDRTYDQSGFVHAMFLVKTLAVIFIMVAVTLTPVIHSNQLYTCEHRDDKALFNGEYWPVSIKYCKERSDTRETWGPWFMTKIVEYQRYD